jgi:hypothetical protein
MSKNSLDSVPKPMLEAPLHHQRPLLETKEAKTKAKIHLWLVVKSNVAKAR